jgi:hypothetical protein
MNPNSDNGRVNEQISKCADEQIRLNRVHHSTFKLALIIIDFQM